MTDKRLYRSRDALAGGICGGIAEYFDIDPIIVRILAVVLAIASFGTFIVIYIILWIIVPVAPDANAPVDVCPESVHSETYGPVYYQSNQEQGKDRSSAHAASQAAAGYTSAGGYYPGTAHVPPEPPRNYTPQQPGTVPLGTAPQPNPSVVPPRVADPVVAEPMSGKSVRTALWFGFLCLFIGLAALLGHFVEGVAWWQFWPLYIAIVGIGQIVIPAQRGKRMAQFVSGIMALAAGGVLLLMSTDVISYMSIEPMIRNLWPILMMMVGFFILSGALKNPLLELLAGLCFVAFCAIGLFWFAIPGSLDFVVLDLPFREGMSITIDPWFWD